MIAIIGTRHRLLTQIIKRSELREVDSIEDFVAYRGDVPHAGGSDSTECVIVLSGTGPERSVKAAKWLFDEFAPELVISAGYSGGVSEDSVPGEVLVASRCALLEGPPVQWTVRDSETFKLPDGARGVARRAVEAGGLDYQIGPMVTIESVVRTVEMKKWLWENFDAHAIDREAHHIAKVCDSLSDIELLVVRCGIDAGGLVSRFLVERINESPKAGVALPALLHLGAHPTHLTDLRQLSRNSNMGREAMTSFIHLFLRERAADRSSNSNGSAT